MHFPNPINRDDSLSERLHQFILAASVVIDELFALVPPSLSAESGCANRDMLRRYNELVQEIRKIANDYKLSGLQSICALVENNMLLLREDSHTLSDEEIIAMREWPELLFGYLVNQADKESSKAFLKNLSTVWPICLSEDAISDQLQLLMGESVTPIATKAVTGPVYGETDDVTESVFDDAEAVAEPVFEDTEAATDPVFDDAEAVIDAVFDDTDAMTDSLFDDTETVNELASDDAETVIDLVFDADQGVTEPVTNAADAVTDTAFDDTEAVDDHVLETEEDVTEPVSDAADVADTAFDDTEAVNDHVLETEEGVTEPVSDAADINDTAFDDTEAVAEQVLKAEEGVTEPVTEATDAATDTPVDDTETVDEHVFDAAEVVTESISDTAEEVADPIIDAAEVVPDTAIDADAAASGPVLDIEMQQIDSEMISLLASELAQMDEQFHGDLAAACHGAEEQRAAALTNYLDFLERLKFTVESVGLTSLASYCEQLVEKINSVDGGLSAEHQALLDQLPDYIAAYLAEPGLESTGYALLTLLTNSVWAAPLAESSVTHWQQALASVEITESIPQAETREVQAKPEDVSLNIPEDVHPELLNGLLLELPVQVRAFSEAIEQISAGKGSAKDMERAMRAAHTLKGAANTVGVAGIANLTHRLEDILAALLNAKKLPQRTLSDLLINASDCLETMSEFLQGMGPAPEHTLEVLQEVLDYANQIDKLISDGDLPEMAQSAPADSDEAAETDSQEQHSSAPQNVAEQSLRIPAPLVDELLRISGETITTNSQIQERLNQSISQTDLIHKQHRLLQQLVVELEELVDIRGVSAPLLAREVKGDDFDDLEFEHYNELHTVTRRLMEAATDAQELTNTVENQLSALGESLDDQHRLQIDNQNAVIRIRMVTVSSVVSRLKRGVRQTARLLDKAVEFTIKGENTSIDGNVLNDLMDPLMHILRNAVDHGIESAEERIAAGKSPEGHIELTFAREGNSIVVRCSDDGKGLNYDAIYSSAERKGMIRPEYKYSNEELERLILLPGFSTRGSASQVSGRGVGMDVVQSRIQEKKGVLTLNSRSNHGLTVELRLPATLLATHTLIVRQREKYLAISSRNIEDIRYCMRDQMLQIGPRQFFQADENMCQLDKLETLLSMPHDRRAEYMDGFPVLLTRMNDGTMRAILVQEILDSREVVMKKFGHFVPRTKGVVGAVILGNGSIAPVIDLVELLQAPAEQFSFVQNPALISSDTEESAQKALSALVVDDSLSARRAMTQVLRDAGYEVRTANDGLAAVDILSKFVPDIILSDMEMPRMNGLELAAHVRYAERTRHIPVIMITSRSTEKHRKMSSDAGVNLHIVKPFSDDALLDHVARLTAK